MTGNVSGPIRARALLRQTVTDPRYHRLRRVGAL
ncbi:hypothetical protein R1CP_28705 [Rhodococcus opacus]|uniref:Uncharacterized protein n=1 Tax=Rhodococcus opacus TaxID=37919 RepID=A0A1B1KCP3_RHOOP|nr:hypothetical protein R1CP_28705 [Rhodococcus opacus]